MCKATQLILILKKDLIFVKKKRKKKFCICMFDVIVGWVLWHINLYRLFNAKSILIQIVLFHTIQFSISMQFKFKYSLIVKNISISIYSV